MTTSIDHRPELRELLHARGVEDPSGLHFRFQIANLIASASADLGLDAPRLAARLGSEPRRMRDLLAGAAEDFDLEDLLWILTALGRDVAIDVRPAAAPDGTLTVSCEVPRQIVSRVVRTPGFKDGLPYIAGTHIPALNVLSNIMKGALADIFRRYPGLPLDAIGAVETWADAEFGPGWRSLTLAEMQSMVDRTTAATISETA